MKKNEPFVCQACGAEVKANAKVCPECGSDEETGWSDHTYLDGISIPDEEDYQEILSSEFPQKQTGLRHISWQSIVGMIVLIVFIYLIVRSISG